MKTTLQRAVCLLLSSALLLSLGACGKKKEKENSVRDVVEETSAETTQEMRKVESHEGKIGEQVTDQEVVATLKKAYVSDYTFTENDQEIGLTFFEFEIQNNGDEELVADMLSRTFGLTARHMPASASVDHGLSTGSSAKRAVHSMTRSSPAKPVTAGSAWKCRRISRPCASLISPEPVSWTGMRRICMTSTALTWRLHRSR
jgi:hypothetical protein